MSLFVVQFPTGVNGDTEPFITISFIITSHDIFIIQITYTAQRNTALKPPKLANLLTTRKNTSTRLNKKFKIRNVTFKTDISQAVAFLVFLGIASSIGESMSASDKSWNFESAEAMV